MSDMNEELLSNILLELKRIRKALEGGATPSKATVQTESTKPKINVHKPSQSQSIFGSMARHEEVEGQVDLSHVSRLLS
jgi:hypothetical protein